MKDRGRMKDRRRVKAGCAAAVLWLGVMLAACGGRTTDPAQETAAGGGLLGSLAEALNDGEKQEAQATRENREAESEQESAGGKTGKEKSSGSGGKAEKTRHTARRSSFMPCSAPLREGRRIRKTTINI